MPPPHPHTVSGPSFFGIPIKEITRYGIGGVCLFVLGYWFTVFTLQPAAVERKLLIDATIATLETNARSMESVAIVMKKMDTKLDILLREQKWHPTAQPHPFFTNPDTHIGE